jgi:hypothetical protein
MTKSDPFRSPLEYWEEENRQLKERLEKAEKRAEENHRTWWQQAIHVFCFVVFFGMLIVAGHLIFNTVVFSQRCRELSEADKERQTARLTNYDANATAKCLLTAPGICKWRTTRNLSWSPYRCECQSNETSKRLAWCNDDNDCGHGGER